MYGSVINRLGEASLSPEPEVGMGVTVYSYSDRHAGTIAEVSASGKSIKIQYDKSERIDSNGMSENQRYEFTPNPDAPKVEFTKRKNGRWIKKGHPMKGGQGLSIGHRDEYYDYSF